MRKEGGGGAWSLHIYTQVVVANCGDRGLFFNMRLKVLNFLSRSELISTITLTTGNLQRTMLEFLNNLWRLGTEQDLMLSYRPARLHRLAELIPWNRFLGSLKVPSSIVFSRSILRSVNILAQRSFRSRLSGYSGLPVVHASGLSGHSKQQK